MLSGDVVGDKPTRGRSKCALYLRSVCWINTAFRGLRCHPLTCMLLNLRLRAGSIPSAVTKSFNDLRRRTPHGSTSDPVLKRRTLARMVSKRAAHLRHTSLGLYLE